MNVKNKLRNRLISKLRNLSTDKLMDVEKFLSKITGDIERKENALRLAGSWEDLEEDIYRDFTSNLHENRLSDKNRSDL